MSVRRPPLLAVLCFGALAVAAVACGDPAAKVHSLAEASATAELATATVMPGATSTADATQPAATSTAEPLATPISTATAGIEPVATKPPPCRTITFSPGATLTAADLAARGRGDPVRKPFIGVNLVIRAIGVNARFVERVVGSDGKMPRVGNATDVAWYDFSQWPGLGGTPGTDHGNVIIAGDYDDIGVPQAVFYRVSDLAPGDLIQINTSDGRTLAYEVEFNKVTTVDGIDWTELAASTPEESITLITAAAPLNKDRRIVWGRALDTGCSH